MYFRITVLIDEAFLSLKSEDSLTVWSSEDSSDPMFLEGCLMTEALLLGVKSFAKFFAELDPEHSNTFLIDLDSDTLFRSSATKRIDGYGSPIAVSTRTKERPATSFRDARWTILI